MTRGPRGPRGLKAAKRWRGEVTAKWRGVTPNRECACVRVCACARVRVCVAMGLKSGDGGAKKWLQLKHADQFRRFPTLNEVRQGVEYANPNGDGTMCIPRSETVVLVDGNVLMMAVADRITSLDEYANVIFNYIRWDAIKTGALVVVVFDEPEHMTNAKRSEQAERDAQRKKKDIVCSEDVAPPPLPREFSRAQLEALADISSLAGDRRYKCRFYDEVIRRVYERLMALMAQWRANGHEPGVVVLDGVEPRGCELPPGETRAPAMVGSDDEVAAALARDTHIGEGDIKLIAIENRLRALKSTNARFHNYTLCMTSTVDTDSFMTMLLDVSKRRVSPYAGAMHSLFCMREPPTKRERDEQGATARASWLVCDTVLLEYKLQCHLWSEVGEKRPTHAQMLQAMLAFCAATAVCGCDFTGKSGQKGSRFDHFWESLPEFVAAEPQALARFGSTLADDAIVARQACDGLLRVCYAASRHMEDKPYGGSSKKTYKSQARELWDVPDTMLRRAVWAAAYWAQREFEADAEWGFPPNLSSDAPVCG